MRFIKLEDDQVKVNNFNATGRNLVYHTSENNKILVSKVAFRLTKGCLSTNGKYLCLVETNLIFDTVTDKLRFYEIKGEGFELVDVFSDPNSEQIVGLSSYQDNKEESRSHLTQRLLHNYRKKRPYDCMVPAPKQFEREAGTPYSNH